MQARLLLSSYSVSRNLVSDTCAEPLLESINPGAVIADKAYDADGLIDKLTEQRATPVIPPNRGIATRYDKLARNYLAAVQLVAAIVLLN